MTEEVGGGADLVFHVSVFWCQVSSFTFQVSAYFLPPDSEGQSWWWGFLVSSVRLLSPPETGGVPAGGGGMM